MITTYRQPEATLPVGDVEGGGVGATLGSLVGILVGASAHKAEHQIAISPSYGISPLYCQQGAAQSASMLPTA